MGLIKRFRLLAGLATLLLLAGCNLFGPSAPTPTPHPHNVVGTPYEADGVWRYPRVWLSYDRTGLASVYIGPHQPLTADGEIFSQSALAAAHPTFQLPALADITNLANGRTLLVRINDRGPADPGRLVMVTKRVALLLGFPPDGVAPVRLRLRAGASLALEDALAGGPKGLGIRAAPVGQVRATELAPPGAGTTSTRFASAGPTPALIAMSKSAILRPDGRVTVVPVGTVQLFVVAGSYGEVVDADRLAARLSGLGAEPESFEADGQILYGIRIGPLADLAVADWTLAAAIAAGAVDASIVIR